MIIFKIVVVPQFYLICQDFVTKKWNFCNTNGDEIITTAEQQDCERRLAAIWDGEEIAAG